MDDDDDEFVSLWLDSYYVISQNHKSNISIY